MKKIKHLWQQHAPGRVKEYIRFLLQPKLLRDRSQAVLEHFKKQDVKKLSPEIREGLNYLKSHKYTPFPYYWSMKYDNLTPEIFRDDIHQSFYVMFEGKRMYFPARYTEKQVAWTVRGIYKEQDIQSPHLYLTPEFQVDSNSIVIDAGVAEGNFALSVVEQAQRLYLIECDKGWMDALRLTFAPWKEKVVFVEKYLSGIESESTVSIDNLVNPVMDVPYFIKMDIEGFEQKALAGMKNLVASGVNIKMDVCTYHHANDLPEIESILAGLGFTWQVTPSYMLYFQDGEEPSFRKVLVRAEKAGSNF